MQTTDESKRKFRHIPEMIMNRGQVDIADQEIAEDYVEHIPMPPGFPPGRQGFKDFALALRAAFPDLHYEVDHLTNSDLIGENQKVVHRIVAHATHLGAWGPFPGTGRRMSWSEIHIGLYVQGMLVEHWGNIDTLAIMQQIGAVPGWQEPVPLPPPPRLRSQTTTTFQQNAEIVRRYIHEVWNKAQFHVADELIHPRSIHANLHQFPIGPEGAKRAAQLYRAAFPDLRLLIQDLVAEENAVAIRFTMTGTHLGNYYNIPPSGRSIEVQGCEIYRIGDGQIIEREMIADTLGLIGQLENS
jgi:steroid delta-isomerase-like uncharacterized protein